MITVRIISLLIVFAFIGLWLNSDSGIAVPRDIAVVLKVQGDADIQSGTNEWMDLQKGKRLRAGDKIRTGQETLVALVFTDDKSMLKVRSDTEIEIGGERTDKGFSKRLYMGIGHMWAQVNPKGAGFRLETPSGVAAVKGTTWGADVYLDKTEIKVLLGLIITSIGDIVKQVGGGQKAILQGNEITILKLTDADRKALEEQGEGLLGQENELEIEYEDENGNKKTLKIKYKEE